MDARYFWFLLAISALRVSIPGWMTADMTYLYLYNLSWPFHWHCLYSFYHSIHVSVIISILSLLSVFYLYSLSLFLFFSWINRMESHCPITAPHSPKTHLPTTALFPIGNYLTKHATTPCYSLLSLVYFLLLYCYLVCTLEYGWMDGMLQCHLLLSHSLYIVQGTSAHCNCILHGYSAPIHLHGIPVHTLTNTLRTEYYTRMEIRNTSPWPSIYHDISAEPSTPLTYCTS